MTIDYQLSILSYLVQCPKESIQYIERLEESIFDLVEDKITIQLLKKYYKKYFRPQPDSIFKENLQ